MKMRISLAFVVVFFCTVSSAGWADQSEDIDALERRIKERRSEGALALTRRIEDLARTAALPDLRRPDSRAASAAAAGELKIASAAWWGWASEDATAALNAALAAPVDTLIIPAMSGPWIVGPLSLTGPKTLLFEPGCTVIAAKGAFRNTGDCLLSIEGRGGITISGYGSRLEMRKDDYTQAPYAEGQWRHAISVRESSDILIEGLSIRSSGGDGVYIGQRRGLAVPTAITLRDLELKDHYRQGVSVIAANGFLMEYCRVVGTRGHMPQAGIDFEPNSHVYGLVDCKVSRCVFSKNAGAAVHVHLDKLEAAGPPADILVEDSALIGSPLAIWVRGLSNGAKGRVEFGNCIIQGLKTIEGSRGLSTVIR
jgi:hypothetical protein